MFREEELEVYVTEPSRGSKKSDFLVDKDVEDARISWIYSALKIQNSVEAKHSKNTVYFLRVVFW